MIKSSSVMLKNGNTRRWTCHELRAAHLVGTAVLDDLGAEVRALDGAEMLVIRLAVARVFEQHIRSARLHLRLDDRVPQLLRAHHSARLSLGLVPMRNIKLKCGLINNTLIQCTKAYNS